METTFAEKKACVLINRNFTLNLCGQIISSAGDFVLITTSILWIAIQLAYRQTWVAMAISGVDLAAALATAAALFAAEVLPCGKLLAEAWLQTITSPKKLPKPSQLRQCGRKREQKRRARRRVRPHDLAQKPIHEKGASSASTIYGHRKHTTDLLPYICLLTLFRRRGYTLS